MILQQKLPYDLASQRPLPGISPLQMADWIHVDEAYLGQMAYRAELLAQKRADVLGLCAEADDETEAAAQELLQMVLADLDQKSGFERSGQIMHCPDGRQVDLNEDHPLATLGLLVQEDFCILQKRGEEHVFTAALLCFPSSWTLAQKLGKPLMAIHVPVDEYDANIGKRVQRLFDGVRPGRPLWRFNILWYDGCELHNPRLEYDHRPPVPQDQATFLRSEKQCILRLPETGATVFSIHTYMLAAEALRS
jgi:hypothetical protein